MLNIIVSLPFFTTPRKRLMFELILNCLSRSTKEIGNNLKNTLWQKMLFSVRCAPLVISEGK